MIAPRKLQWGEAVSVILCHGEFGEPPDAMVNVFEIAKSYGPGTKNEFVCMAGYVIAGFSGYIRQYSEGWYILTEKGLAKKAHVTSEMRG